SKQQRRDLGARRARGRPPRRPVPTSRPPTGADVPSADRWWPRDAPGYGLGMRISLSSDMTDGVAGVLAEEVRRRGHEVITHGALNADERDDWACSAEATARDVAEGLADHAIVCCWTCAGAALAANKVRGVRAALLSDAYTAS